MTRADLIGKLELAAFTLREALSEHHAAALAHADAKAQHEDAKAFILREGVPGKNEAERGAFAHGALGMERQALHAAEAALSEARCSLDKARLDFDVARYTIRILEVTKE